MKVTIRRAYLPDASLLSHISSAWFRQAFDGTCSPDDMLDFNNEFYSTEQLEKELSDENDFFYIAFQGNEAVGHMRLKQVDGKPIKEIENLNLIYELKRFYMSPEVKGKGVAQQMMDKALQLASEWQAEAMMLSVWEYNMRVRLFYEKYGFTNTGILNPFPIGNTPQNDIWYYKIL